MNVYHEETMELLPDPDLELGRTYPGRRFVAHHEAVEEVRHLEVMRGSEAMNGGKGLRGPVIDVPASPAWDEYEDCLLYHPYTEEELAAMHPPYVAFNLIPEGIYRANGTDWGPEIRADAPYVMDNILGMTSLGNYSDNGNTDASTSLTRSFSLTANNFYLIVCDVGGNPGTDLSASLNTPNCTNLLNLSYSDTQDRAYYGSRLIVRIVRCNANATATASVRANTVRSAGRIFCYKLNKW